MQRYSQKFCFFHMCNSSSIDHNVDIILYVPLISSPKYWTAVHLRRQGGGLMARKGVMLHCICFKQNRLKTATAVSGKNN